MNAISVPIVSSALYTEQRSYRRRAAELLQLLVADRFRADQGLDRVQEDKVDALVDIVVRATDHLRRPQKSPWARQLGGPAEELNVFRNRVRAQRHDQIAALWLHLDVEPSGREPPGARRTDGPIVLAQEHARGTTLEHPRHRRTGRVLGAPQEHPRPDDLGGSVARIPGVVGLHFQRRGRLQNPEIVLPSRRVLARGFRDRCAGRVRRPNSRTCRRADRHRHHGRDGRPTRLLSTAPSGCSCHGEPAPFYAAHQRRSRSLDQDAGAVPGAPAQVAGFVRRHFWIHRALRNRRTRRLQGSPNRQPANHLSASATPRATGESPTPAALVLTRI